MDEELEKIIDEHYRDAPIIDTEANSWEVYLTDE
jgi:hypothetical protein